MILIDRQETISGGNFHGEYPAKALDYLAIGIHEIASISERRTERMCNPGGLIWVLKDLQKHSFHLAWTTDYDKSFFKINTQIISAYTVG